MKKLPLLVLNHRSSLAPYEQIGAQIQALIASAQLLPGVLLPSVRQLAQDLEVAPNTILRTYNELAKNGWVIIEKRRGVIVAPHPPEINPEERAQQLEQVVADLLATTQPLGFSAQELCGEIIRQSEQPL